MEEKLQLTQKSPSCTKIALFRSLFRGCEDLYPQRFESKISSVEAYRRDRRKDILLQENGYKILRFLAEDAGKRLDDVLDTILRILSSHQKHAATADLHWQ